MTELLCADILAFSIEDQCNPKIPARRFTKTIDTKPVLHRTRWTLPMYNEIIATGLGKMLELDSLFQPHLLGTFP